MRTLSNSDNLLLTKFLSKVYKTKTCWIWFGPRDKDGRGLTTDANGRCITSPRMSYKLFVGEIPPKEIIGQICFNPSCVNPNHLICCSRSANYNRTDPLLKRFLRRVRKTEKCWIWTGPTCKAPGGPRGILKIEGKQWYAHRASYRLFKGRIPDGMVVMHSCDNPICCNPKHLMLGTQKDNMRDAIKKGRFVFRKKAV